MNKYVLLLFLLIANNGFGQEYWKQVETPLSLDFNSIFCLDSAHIWIAADSGKILFTSDRGDNWIIQDTGIEESVENVFFLDVYIGYALALKLEALSYRSYLIKTTDGGASWTPELYRIENVHLHSVYFLDSLRGFLGGSPQELVYTINGGDEWKYSTVYDTTGAYFPVYNIEFMNDSIGFAVGGYYDAAGIFWRTENGGVDWYPYSLSAEPIFNIHILDSTNLFIVVGDLERFYQVEIYKSSDLGKSWEFQLNDIYGFITASDFRNDMEIWATLGSDRLAMVSFNQGGKWEYHTMPDSVAVYDVQFIDSVYGFMVGENGSFFKYNPQDPTSVKSDSDVKINADYHLYQNYPNPFNSQTEVKYSLAGEASVKIVLYDILGREIMTIDEGVKPAGIHTSTFELNAVPSGVYFYQLNINSTTLVKSETKKMVLLK